MLSGLTAKKFNELKAYDEMCPSGETRMDERFAILTAIVAATGNIVGQDKRPYSPDTFLQALNRTIQPAAPVKKQTVAEMESILKAWTDTSNQARRERGQS